MLIYLGKASTEPPPSPEAPTQPRREGPKSNESADEGGVPVLVAQDVRKAIVGDKTMQQLKDYG
jgi:hypothetical protein